MEEAQEVERVKNLFQELVQDYNQQMERKRSNSIIEKRSSLKALKVLGFDPSKEKAMNTLGLEGGDFQQVLHLPRSSMRLPWRSLNARKRRLRSNETKNTPRIKRRNRKRFECWDSNLLNHLEETLESFSILLLSFVELLESPFRSIWRGSFKCNLVNPCKISNCLKLSVVGRWELSGKHNDDEIRGATLCLW